MNNNIYRELYWFQNSSRADDFDSITIIVNEI